MPRRFPMKSGGNISTPPDHDLGELRRRIRELEEREAKREAAEHALQRIAESTSLEVGEKYFQKLVRSVGETLGAKAVVLSERTETEGQFRVVAISIDGVLGDTFTYLAQGAPCGHLMGKSPALFSEAVSEKFPDFVWLKDNEIESYLGIQLLDSSGLSLGHFVVMDDKPMTDSDFPLSILQTFSGRAASELERQGMLAKLQYRINFESFISNISTDFINLTSKEVDAGIEYALADLGNFCNADRAFVFLKRSDMDVWDNSHEWCAPDVPSQIMNLQGINFSEDRPYIGRLINRLETIHIASRDDLPAEARAEKAFLKSLNVESFIAVPMIGAGKLVGILGLQSIEAGQFWSDDTAAILRIVGECFVSAFERRQSDQAQRENESRIRATLEAIPDVIMTLDRDGKVLHVSPAKNMTHLIFNTRMQGKTLDEELPGDVALLLKSAIRKTLDSGETQELEYSLPIGDRLFDFEARFVAIGPLEALVLIRDITDAKQAEEAMRMASRMEATATLAGGVAHDFNNLMAGVLGNALLVYEDLGPSHPCAEKLNTIAIAAERAGKLSHELLAFARGGKYQPQIADLNQVVEETLLLQKGAFPPGVTLVRESAPDLWPVEVDPTQVGQVIMNLAINAAEAIEGIGEMVFRTFNLDADEAYCKDQRGLIPGKYSCLLVSDTGCGMTEETLRKVFEPFYTTKIQGRGLGLAAVYGIIKNHGGYIHAESAPNEGTTFTVYLPAAEGEVSHPQAPKRKRITGTETILIVDDEEIFVKVIREVVEGLGFTMLTAGNGAEAIDIAKSHPGEIHLILLDMGMPVMSGPEAFSQLVRARPGIKVIICSGYGLDKASRALLDAGAFSFLQKPFMPRDLIAEIRRALDS